MYIHFSAVLKLYAASCVFLIVKRALCATDKILAQIKISVYKFLNTFYNAMAQ